MRLPTAFFLILMCGVFNLYWLSQAKSHEWYDPWCCNEEDCKTFEAHGATMVVDHKLKAFIVTVNGVDFRFPFGSDRIRASQDENYHVCILRSGMESRDLEARCLYIPGMS